jgi:hypothetical protein
MRGRARGSRSPSRRSRREGGGGRGCSADSALDAGASAAGSLAASSWRTLPLLTESVASLPAAGLPPSSPSSPSPSPRRRRGSVILANDDDDYRSAAITDSQAACLIAAGDHHTAVVTRNGCVYVMGWAADGRLGVGPSLPETLPTATPLLGVPTTVGVACGGAHTLLLTADGRVLACGDNSMGQCGVGAPAAAATDADAPRRRGTARQPGGDSLQPAPAASGLARAPASVFTPREVAAESTRNVVFQRVVAGARHSGAVTLEGKLLTWGMGAHGALGNGDDGGHAEPRPVQRFAALRVLQASFGDAHSAAILSRGRGTLQPVVADDAEVGSGGLAMDLPLPILLRRERFYAIKARRRAAAYAVVRRKAVARAVRRRLLRRYIREHAGGSGAAGAAGSTANTGVAGGGAGQPAAAPSAAAAAAAARSAVRGAALEASLREHALHWWERPGVDDAVYGFHTAALLVQRAYGRYRRRVADAYYAEAAEAGEI